ncbi:MAG: class IV adenylate cyclase [bacterium]|nr:class IV adenylate cyclase [bacterium]
MPSNVEIKARVADPTGLRERALAVATRRPEIIEQTDTFFAVARGRLKVRRFADGSGELIHYERPDAEGPKTSRYALCPVTDADLLVQVLSGVLPPGVVVRKRRELVMAGRTRIHLDEVAELGHFMELEVVLAEGEEQAAGEAEARELMAKLGIAPQDLVEGAYADMLARP